MENLSRTIPPIDSDQKVALLLAPFKGTTLFRGELAKLQKANKERASSLTVKLQQHPLRLTPLSLSYTGRGRSFRKGGSSYRRGGRIDPPL